MAIDIHRYRSMSIPATRCSPLVREPLSEPSSGEFASMFKALGDPVRLRLLSLVASHAGGVACVCDISGSFDVTQPTISHHLKILRLAGLLESERRGTWVYYRIIPAALQQLSSILHATDPTNENTEAFA